MLRFDGVYWRVALFGDHIPRSVTPQHFPLCFLATMFFCRSQSLVYDKPPHAQTGLTIWGQTEGISTHVPEISNPLQIPGCRSHQSPPSHPIPPIPPHCWPNLAAVADIAAVVSTATLTAA